jgi:transcription factor E
MSDEDIAKRCGLKVSDVRSVLNKLHEYGITGYMRERDKDTGWFSYNWTVNVIKLYEVMEKRQARGERRDQEALSYEKSYTFYTCKNAACPGSGQRISENDAILTTYACNHCGGHLKLFDNSEIIKSIEEKLASKIPEEQTFIKEFKLMPTTRKTSRPNMKPAQKNSRSRALSRTASRGSRKPPPRRARNLGKTAGRTPVAGRRAKGKAKKRPRR